eukprot:TRINITY_DN2124_c1_g2_i2.p1 TRINITY_DN2124_c1_g2~~TRINITY_DN2124_c1_g2_i2.p1  ORF type:complete len:449 (-),score=55.41 TRINITY_DN2124_c1_g2_i2:314-1660(-)
MCTNIGWTKNFKQVSESKTTGRLNGSSRNQWLSTTRAHNNSQQTPVTKVQQLHEEISRKVDQQTSSEVGHLEDQLSDVRDTINNAYKNVNSLQSKLRHQVKRVQDSNFSAELLEYQPLEKSIPAESSQDSVFDSRGLQSSLQLEKSLTKQWYAVAFVSQVAQQTQFQFELLGKQWILFNNNEEYHCTSEDLVRSIGAERAFKKVDLVKSEYLRCVVKDEMLWICPDNSLSDSLIPDVNVPQGFSMHAEIEVEVPVEHGLLMENLLDLAHAPFTHTSTFAKGWPVPDVVKFHMSEMLGGDWDPYPIDMSFQPPCMVLSTIGLAQPGKIMRGLKAQQCQRHLHQLHVCLPSKKGHTRLLYRMSLDFMGWLKYVPMIQKVWEQVAGQVLGEDLVLVLGQQDRLQRGGNTWANPVSYDKLAVRYRRWRNQVGGAGNHKKISVDAGELFKLED